MKPFLLRLSLFGGLQLLIALVVLLRGNPSDGNHFYLAIKDKVRRMEDTERPRLLLVGGSNVAFGIDSRMLEETGHVPVNLGLTAGLGLDFYLNLIKQRVRAEDIIVLIPEYELLSTPANPTVQKELLAVCPEFAPLFELPADAGPSWKYRLDHQALATIHVWVRNAFRRQDKGPGIYRRGSFNEFGDMVAHLSLPRPEGDVTGAPIAFDRKVVEESIRKLNAFADYCQSRGAEVYFSHPPIPKERFDQSRKALSEYRRQLDQELKMPVIDGPAEQVYDNDQFFDTCYHLTGDAIAERTRRLKLALKNARPAANPIDLKTALGRERQTH